MQPLDIISVNIWQIAISLLNLLILFLIIRKFLFKPVKKMIADREAKVSSILDDAQNIKKEAEADKAGWEARMKTADDEANSIIRQAKIKADRRSERILNDAKDHASEIVRQAKYDAELERIKAEDGIRHEIIDLSSVLTRKMLRREINDEDQKELIDEFISEISEIS